MAAAPAPRPGRGSRPASARVPHDPDRRPAGTGLAPLGGGTFDLQSLDLLDTYPYNQQTFQFSACGAGCLVRSSLGGELQLATTGTVTFAGAALTGVEWIEVSARPCPGRH
jgi:hypothetical protein